MLCSDSGSIFRDYTCVTCSLQRSGRLAQPAIPGKTARILRTKQSSIAIVAQPLRLLPVTVTVTVTVHGRRSTVHDGMRTFHACLIAQSVFRVPCFVTVTVTVAVMPLRSFHALPGDRGITGRFRY